MPQTPSLAARAAPAPNAPAGRLAPGIALVASFEALLVVHTGLAGSLEFALGAAGAALLLGFAWWQAREGAPHPLLFAGVALLALHRAVAQSLGGVRSVGLLVSYLVPLGFLLLAASPRAGPRLAVAGIALVALARSWFALFYLTLSPPVALLVVANVAGAAGAWLWTLALRERRAAHPD